MHNKEIYNISDTTQITLKSVTLIKRGSDVVLRDRIHRDSRITQQT